MPDRSAIRRIFQLRRLLIAAGISACLIVLLSLLIGPASRRWCASQPYALPEAEAGVVLGTGRISAHGGINPYYSARIDAAVELWRSGRVHWLLISGDNSRQTYDEPSEIKADLVKRGVPAARIYRDYAGFRTLDSMRRAQLVFGLKKVIVVSQGFHNERAIWLARRHGLEAWGLDAQDPFEQVTTVTAVREKLARIGAVLDWIIGREPHFLGPQLRLGIDPPS
ncbi:MAG: hypothetical protein RL095_3801 [Verrucomicrobiota bacterium]|jgi:SanA protein